MTFCYVFRAEEVAPHNFLFRRKSASRLRSRHTPSFFAENPRVGTFSPWGRATRLPFSLTTCVARGQRYCLKRHPMWFFVSKRHPTWKHASKNATKNARNHVSKTRALPAPDDTAPAPPSPSLVRWCDTLTVPHTLILFHTLIWLHIFTSLHFLTLPCLVVLSFPLVLLWFKPMIFEKIELLH